MDGIITFRSNPINIGDYIQSLAASKFVNDSDPIYVEREKISEIISDEPINVIMNAWWMWSNHWPPAQCINPLFVSFHLTPNASKWVLNDKGVKYLQQHEPIGCRDTNTMKLLSDAGIKSYFSACLTLTLGKMGKYIPQKRSEEIIICDPYYNITKKSLFNMLGRVNFILLIYTFIKNYRFFHRIHEDFGYKHKMFNVKSAWVRKVGMYFQLAYFYRVYTSLFSEELLQKATYTTHWIMSTSSFSDKELLARADTLIQKYSQAKLIITSRIHCALPSIGCESPVLFVTSDELYSASETKVGGRLDGLDDFFHLISYNRNHSLTPTFSLKGSKIGAGFSIQNKPNYMPYRDALIEKCMKFFRNE